MTSIEADIDLNSLFTLTHNFDLLKNVIQSLIKANKENSLKLNEIENQIKNKDQVIEE
jgi:hypothetical protein